MFHETGEGTFVGTCCVAEEVTLSVIIIVAVIIIDVVGGVGSTGEIFTNRFKERFGLLGGIPILCCCGCTNGGGAEEESYGGGMFW